MTTKSKIDIDIRGLPIDRQEQYLNSIDTLQDDLCNTHWRAPGLKSPVEVGVVFDESIDWPTR